MNFQVALTGSILSLAAASLLQFHQATGRVWKTVMPVPVSGIEQAEGSAYKIIWSRVKKSYGRFHPAAAVLENGAPLRVRAEHSKQVKNGVPGSFSFGGKAIWFRASDDSDPRNNGRNYALLLPRVLPPGSSALVLLLFATGVGLGCRIVPNSRETAESPPSTPFPQEGNRSNAIVNGLWLLVFGVGSSIWCLTAAQTIGPGWDEPLYLKFGLEHWRTGSSLLFMEHGTMPLAVDLQTLPLFLWECWHGREIDLDQEMHRVLPWARAVTLLFWWVLLIYSFRLGRMLAGNWGGRLALAFTACEPVMVGFAALVASDIPVAACLMAMTYEFRASRHCGWQRRVGLISLLFGAALLVKASALIFGPLCLLAVELERWWRNGTVSDRRRWLASGKDLGNIFLLGLLVTLVYCGSAWNTRPALVDWARSLDPGNIRDAMVWLTERAKIFPNAMDGFMHQIRHNLEGHGAYIAGREFPDAVWYYFPLALTIKSSVALLLLPVIVAFARARALLNLAFLAALVLLADSITCRVQIGIRFMFPLMVFLCVGIGAALAQARRPGVFGPLAAVAILWNAASLVRVWPNAICYTNERWGGTGQGCRWLSDSNYDWGQGLPELRQWARRKGIDVVDVWYFGNDPSVRVLPLRELPLQRLHEWKGQSVQEIVAGKRVAVSTTMRYGVTYPHTREAAGFFRPLEPTDRTMTYFIYDFRGYPTPPRDPGKSSGTAIEDNFGHLAGRKE